MSDAGEGLIDADARIQERMEAGGLYARPDGTAGIFVYAARLLVHRASLTPSLARRKVFIVGDAERMVPQASSQEAANAFLKLLVAQMKYQDPMNPAQGADYIAQTAQFTVVEKLEELRQIIAISKTMGVEPMIGLRVRLSAKGAGKWAQSGGENAKFGLSTAELVAASEALKRRR